MGKSHKYAGFGIRLLARLIDFAIVALISNILLFACMKQTKGIGSFRYVGLFYFGALFTAALIIIIFVLIPIITKGSSIGYKICKIKVITEKISLTKAIIEREVLYGFAGALILILSTILINHTLIFKLANRSFSTKTNVKLTTGEQTRISVSASIASLIFVIQAFVAISIILNKNNLGIHDRISQTKVIRTNKVLIDKPNNDLKFITKRAIKNKELVGIGKEIYD